ncbi:hypothetical protein Ndes2526B_g07525 [Nannochloris sp. 'desiccata']
MPPRSKSQSQSKPRAAGPQDYDPTTQFLYVPHTVTFLLAGLVALAYFSHPLNPPQRPENPVDAAQTAYFNAKTGIWALVLVFLGYSVVQGPSTKMVRPHPAFWKLVHGMTVCYLLFWVYMLFQNVDDARLFLRHMYPELGVDLDERSYGGNCALILPNGGGINWPVIKATIFDEFVVAHTLGWWGKALIIRDNVMLWIISISFELMELTFQHWLPNFNECWWDSWLLDVAICNAIGIVTGMWTVRYFKSKQYNWRGISEQPNLVAKARRGLLQFTPYSYQDFRWETFSSPKRCLQCFFPAVIILLFEVNHFFLKYELWVPPTNPLNTIRLSFLFLLALPGIKEYYEFIDSGDTDLFRKVGTFAWLGMAVAFIETLATIKFGHGLFPQPWPKHVLVAWGTVAIVFLIVFSTWTVRFYRKEGGGGMGGGGQRRQTRAKTRRS